ncbi:MAG: metallophosphoesterase [Sedimentisphaerales bacterium]|nr:metallophosphoesterase [Sedimentisphaerales bacterium]
MDQTQYTELTRRKFVGVVGSALAVLGLTKTSIVRADKVRPAPRKQARRILRLAHMTDIHVQPERWADKGLTACLRHIQDLKDRPSLILTGGDTVMDSFGQDEQRTSTQWNLYRSILKSECSVPVRSCIGNHDVWGWNRKDSKTTGDEPLWGKKRAVHELNIPDRFYSFDQAGWHFIMLDATSSDGRDGYVARLDDEQFDWLSRDLARTPVSSPVLVVSHEPILSAAAFFDGDNEESGDWKVPAAWMCIDARRLKDLFKDHPNVKLCLSGHLHLVDRVDYCGVSYICDGAVCAGWWKGDYQECDEGYGLIDLYDDGSFAHQYVSFDWTPMPEPEKKT